MNLLIATAAFIEIEPIIKQLNLKEVDKSFYSGSRNDKNIDVIITGVGIPMMCYRLTKALIQKKYDKALNLGICGSFTEKFDIGSICNVKQDCFGDIGIENDGNLKTLFEYGFQNPNDFPFKNGYLINTYSENLCNAPDVTGVTINTVTDNQNIINLRKNKFKADIETMEGAAFSLICLTEKIKFEQIRAVSNFVAPRSKACWNIPLAIKNLADAIENLI